MRLTTFSDYTIRVLIYLGLQNGKLVTISEIARAYDISENHLMKVVHQLALRGDVETLRGKGGGIRLAREAEHINLGVLLRATEGGESLLGCMDVASDCRIQSCCKLIPVLKEAQDALFAVLDRYSLADLLCQQEPLARILMPEQGALPS